MRADQLNNQSIENQLPIPVVEFNNDQFYFIENINAESSNEDVTESLLPQKTYSDLLEEEKQKANFNLKQVWEMNRSDKSIKSIVDRFGQKIKPYFVSLASMDGKPISIKTLTTFQKDMEKIASHYLPDENCPIDYPAINYYERAIEKYLKDFISELERKNCKVIFLKFSDRAKAKHEIILKIIGFISPNTPENWLLS